MMDKVRRSVALTVVILTAVSLQWVTGLKVVVAERSLNLTTYDNELIHTNEVPHWNETQEDDTIENYEDQLDQFPDKPNKFDLDITQFTQTDDKNLHRIESETLANSSSLEERNQTKNSMECANSSNMSCIQANFEHFIDKMSKLDEYNVTDLVQIVKSENATNSEVGSGDKKEFSLVEKVHRFARNHVLKIRVPTDLITSRKSRMFFGSVFEGKSSFLTGFGLGFLAFGLKKLLLPLVLGAQIVKSILIALFLPSIIGSIGKIVGKGVSSFAQSSQSATAQPEENFEFKENYDAFGDDYMNRQPVGTLPASAMYEDGMLQVQKNPEIASRYSFVDPRIPHMNTFSDRYYTRHIANNGLSTKKQDFKIFHEIPSSSMMLTNYDPFYSPLLSRLDAVFSRLGHMTEGCREFAVCAMYRSPARYAPYSNLVSAQLSRELNELRKPSSDNPDVLRFFRYMKAAKDGQDGVRCEEMYANCEVARDDSLRQNQAMLATYQDIDKLVHARKL